MLASDWSKPNNRCFLLFFWSKTITNCISATVQDRSMCNTPNCSYFQRVSFFMANLKCWLLIGQNLILAVLLHFLVKKLILAVFRQPFKIEACVIRQIVRISASFTFYGKFEMLASHWSKINIGLFFGIFGRKLILAVFRQPFKIEACVIRQIIRIFSALHIELF